jgi:hypothetical protein
MGKQTGLLRHSARRPLSLRAKRSNPESKNWIASSPEPATRLAEGETRWLLAMTATISLTASWRKRLICPSCQSVAVDLKRKSAAFLVPSRLGKRGVCAIVTKREAGCDGRKRRTRRMRIACGRRSRVVLTSRRWRQVGGSRFADDGDKNARSPGRPRRKPLKPFAQGRPDEFGGPVVTTLVCSFCFACEAAGASSARLSLRPLYFGGTTILQNPGANASRECEFASLRGAERRSNPGLFSQKRFWIASLRSQ